jgi:light-regulated signal transduction histidine kinase (bacteriophytochrome)
VNEANNIDSENVTVRQLAARTRELQSALSAADKEIDSLTYSIAHDLRTPLMHIDGFAQLLEESAGPTLDADSLDHLSRVRGAARTMHGQIEALLEYARLNRAKLVAGETDLEELLDETLEALRAQVGTRNVQWQRSSLPCVRADAVLMRQVLVSLMSNALKYTTVRDPAVIEIGTRMGDSGETIVFVRDNGVGFDPKYADRLFTPFQRMHAADTYPGVGMGLAKVRRILTRHGGRVWFESAPGAGSTFYFSLPADVG